jgi:hypothetical protein
MIDNDILDDLFFSCALAAFLEQANAQRGWPDSEATRRRAYELYEQALADKNGPAAPAQPGWRALTSSRKRAKVGP